MNRDTALNIWLATLENDGGTLSATTGQPFEGKTGYAVAVQDAHDAEYLSIDADRKRILEEIIIVANEFGTPYVGTWIDENNRLYIDPVVVVDDLEVAKELGIEFSQKAIWDFAAGSEIYL